MRNVDEEIITIKTNIKDMVEYLLLKVRVKDWHAVADAAMDIRELEAKIEVLKSFK